MNILGKLAVALTASFLLAAPVAAQEKIIFGISAPTGSLQHQTAVEFLRIANARLGDLGEVVLYPDAQLGNDKDLMQKIRFGTVHITLPSSIMPEVDSRFALFDLPFMLRDRAHVAQIEKTIFKDMLVPAALAKGYLPLAVWENGFRQITNNVRPINTPADLKGLKIRTPNSSWRVAMFREFGANPTPMPFSELFVALQTGVVDGQENPLVNISSGKLDEVQKYLSMTGHVYSPAYPTMGAAVFDKFDPKIQTILLEAAQEAAIWSRAMGQKGDDRLVKKLVEGGMKMNVADHDAFVAASVGVYDKFASEVEGGAALIEQVRALGAGE
jgi:tripartite ATP-independent transporter DctP family solute receptor|tara:strand:+ start:955 stop:1938 length:984 start_codon:yes stop_codon:yes gene_type:complete